MTDPIDVLSDAGLRTGEVLPRPGVHRVGKTHRAVRLYLPSPDGAMPRRTTDGRMR